MTNALTPSFPYDLAMDLVKETRPAFDAAYEIYSVIDQRPDDNIAHFAHIGGMLFSFIIIKFNLLKHR